MKNKPLLQFDKIKIEENNGFLFIQLPVKNCSHKQISVCKTILLSWWTGGDNSMCGCGINPTNNKDTIEILPGDIATIYGDIKVCNYSGLISIECCVICIEPNIGFPLPIISYIYNETKNKTQQGDAPENSAIKNPTPCSLASLAPPRLGVFNCTIPGDL